MHESGHGAKAERWLLLTLLATPRWLVTVNSEKAGATCRRDAPKSYQLLPILVKNHQNSNRKFSISIFQIKKIFGISIENFQSPYTSFSLLTRKITRIRKFSISMFRSCQPLRIPVKNY